MARYDISVIYDDEPPSKTKRKEAMHALQALGKELVELSDAALASVEMPEVLAKAVREARRLTSHEGIRRQNQYIGKIMRNIDAEPLRERLAEMRRGTAASAARHQGLERWRERLIAEDAALTEFLAAHPGADIQALRAAIRNARKEAAASGNSQDYRPPHAFRELFRLVREAAAPAPAHGAPIEGAPD